jgi:hypothetical protein
LVNAQSINAILNADQNGILNGFPNGNPNVILSSTKCSTAIYIDSKQVTSANQLPGPTLDSISGIPSPIKGSFIEIDLPTVDANIPNYKQVISVVTNKRGDLSTVKGCSDIVITGGCGKASVQIPSNCVSSGVLSGSNIIYTILFQFHISTGIFDSKYDFSTTATIASTAKTTTQVLVTQPSVTPGDYTFLNSLWNDLNQTYTVTIGVTPSILKQFKFVGLTYTYSYLNAQNVVIPIKTPSSLVNANQDPNTSVTVTFTITSLTSGCALQSFTLNGIYVAVNPQSGGAQDYSISNGVVSTVNNPKLYSDTASATAINTNAAPVCNTGNAGRFIFPNAVASISSCQFYQADHNTLDSAAVFNDYIDCVGSISNLNDVTFDIKLTSINGYNWADSTESDSNNLQCSLPSSSCTSFQLAAPCANAASTKSADCYYTIAQGSSVSQLILAFTLTITSVNGVSVQKRDNSLSIRDSLDTKKAIALIGTVMTTSSSLDVFSNEKNATSAALTHFFKGIDKVTLNALLVTAGFIVTL